jgi:hypothetical protein
MVHILVSQPPGIPILLETKIGVSRRVSRSGYDRRYLIAEGFQSHTLRLHFFVTVKGPGPSICVG